MRLRYYGIMEVVPMINRPLYVDKIMAYTDTPLSCRIGTAKNFTLLLLLYLTQVKSQGMKLLMAGGGVALIGTTLVPLLSGLFG